MRADDGELAALRPLPGFEEFYRDNCRQMERLGHLLSGSRAAGEDLAQEALLATSLAWDELNSPGAFARRVLVNKAASYTRRQVVSRRHSVAQRGPTYEPGIDYLWDVIAHLPAELRVAVVLRFYEDLTVDEIAELTGVPPGTVKSRLHRAMARMRRELR